MTKPSLPQGTRDFGPETVRKRNYILQTIRAVFETYGFQPLETPAMENLSTLLGKYGEEGDKLIFKILNNGLDRPEKEQDTREAFEKVLQGKNSIQLTERALRYDLTIPFARYVAMNHQQLTLPFKRYQVQPVWRADRPQKGRYREFYQCDADVVGSRSPLNETELALIYHEVFTRLGLTGYTLQVNNRQILAALANRCGGPEKMTDITIAIDKLDKIGLEKVKEELAQRGLSENQILLIEEYLAVKGTNEEILSGLDKLVGHDPAGAKGIAELRTLLQSLSGSLLPTPGSSLPSPGSRLIIDPTLARGLNYYTGIIFEAKAPKEVKMGSIGGGGRYDDLTGLFGVPDIPGVGISFGVDRIYDVLEELQLFPADVFVGTQVLFFNLGAAESARAFALLQGLRQKGIRGELYHENLKFDKQFKYAEKKNIPFVVILGEKELGEGRCNLKDLRSGVQHSLTWDELMETKFTER
ncbi:MAG: histidine--tRNA ligase [Chitinophagaceae bacterium]|nr:histidine--tRNA ligase [Chitinophagaceae bacterium]